jgi:hypothetical protein
MLYRAGYCPKRVEFLIHLSSHNLISECISTYITHIHIYQFVQFNASISPFISKIIMTHHTFY